MVLAGAAMAQQPEEQASPETKAKKSQAAEAKPGTQKGERGALKTKETPATSPAKGKKSRAEQEQNKQKPETGTKAGGQTNVSQSTKVNKQEFKSRHSEVFNLGRHPKEFFVERFGANHFRLIGNTYFVFVDTCWVAVDVEGFVFVERVICPGDPDFIVVD